MFSNFFVQTTTTEQQVMRGLGLFIGLLNRLGREKTGSYLAMEMRQGDSGP
jgi:hypothetical protein